MRDALPPTQWLVFTPHAVAGTHWHKLATRKLQREFAQANGGYCYDLRRRRH